MTTNPYNLGYGAGFVEAKVSQLRKLVCRLENRTNFSGCELECLQTEMREMEAEVKLQLQMSRDDRLGRRVGDFMALLGKGRALLRGLDEQVDVRDEVEDLPGDELQETNVEVQGLVCDPRDQVADQHAPMAELEERLPLRMRSMVDCTPTFVAVRCGQSNNLIQGAELSSANVATRPREWGQPGVSYGVQYREVIEHSGEASRGRGGHRGRCETRRYERSSGREHSGERGRVERGRHDQDGGREQHEIGHSSRHRNVQVVERDRRQRNDNRDVDLRGYDVSRERQYRSRDRSERRGSTMPDHRRNYNAKEGADREVERRSNGREEAGGCTCRQGSNTVAADTGSRWRRQQEIFSHPVRGRPYPPIREELPIPLRLEDPDLVGMAEIYVRPRYGSPKRCPLCPYIEHKLYRCMAFRRMGLRERWYTVLRLGLCLNCLIPGHSHYTCETPGACCRCGKRHNSQLCPIGPCNRR